MAKSHKICVTSVSHFADEKVVSVHINSHSKEQIAKAEILEEIRRQIGGWQQIGNHQQQQHSQQVLAQHLVRLQLLSQSKTLLL